MQCGSRALERLIARERTVACLSRRMSGTQCALLHVTSYLGRRTEDWLSKRSA